jgi:chromosome segregation ATPase
MPNQTEQQKLEKILIDLKNQAKLKKVELEDLGRKVNSLLDEKLSIVNSINDTRQRLANLTAEKKKLEADNRAVGIFIKDQREALDKESIVLNTDKEKFEDAEAQFEANKQKIMDSFRAKEKDLAKDKQATKEAEQKAKEEIQKYEDMQGLLNTELTKLKKLQQEYEKKTAESKVKQEELTVNLDKSKEIKAILDSKILETDNLKNQYEGLIKANENKATSLDKQQKEQANKTQELEEKIKIVIQKETNFVNRQAELDEREKQLNLKELRILKLAKDKDVQKELAQLEEELGIKK